MSDLPNTPKSAALSQTAGVPEGWKLVPVAPTDEMIDAAWECDSATDYVGEHKRIHSAADAYQAMLAAAPAASGGDRQADADLPGMWERADLIGGMTDAEPQPPSAASVSERARALMVQAYRDGGFPRAAGILEAGVIDTVDSCALRAIEQALTQQRGEVLDRPARVGGRDFKAGELVQRVVGRAHAEYDRHHGGCLRHPYTGELRDYRDVESDPDGTLCVGPEPLAATTPQPSADAVRDDRCRHENGSPGHDHWRCRDCGAFKTDSGWGVASHRYFNSRSEAEFYREHGRLPEHAGTQPWGNDHQQNAAQGGGEK